MLTHLPRIRGYRLCIGPSSLPTEHVFCLISFLSWLLSVYRSPSSSNPAETVFFMDRLLFPWRRRPGPEQPGCRWRCRRRPGTRRPESSSCVKCPPAALTSSVFPTFSAWGFSLAGLANRTGRGQNQFTLAKSPVSAGAEHRERALLTQRSAGILGGVRAAHSRRPEPGLCDPGHCAQPLELCLSCERHCNVCSQAVGGARIQHTLMERLSGPEPSEKLPSLCPLLPRLHLSHPTFYLGRQLSNWCFCICFYLPSTCFYSVVSDLLKMQLDTV